MRSKENQAGNSLPLLPLRDLVVFPHMVVPLLVGRQKSIRALEEADKKDKAILLCAQRAVKVEEPNPDDIYNVGTVAQIIQSLKLPDGSYKLLVEGLYRVRIKRFLPNKEFLRVEVEYISADVERTVEIEALMRSLINQFEEYAKLNPRVPTDAFATIANIDNPDQIADTVASYLTLRVSERQSILEIVNPIDRIKRLTEVLNSEIGILQVEKKIASSVRKQIEKAQKEYFLQEQLKAIEKELGQKDEHKSEIDELKDKIKQAKMAKEAQEVALRELEKLARMYPSSPEATVSRNYIDWLIALPWSIKTEDKLDIKNAERILNEDHYGLGKPKERILEYLAVRKLVKSMKGQILCFVGPPGVGKTSLAKSIARALGRHFVRVSLGGVRDEAEIRGHRRTYIGSLPGRIIQSIRKAKSKNPVFLMDEVDKMAMDFRGDPAAALLEVLDPEQNSTFSDHYLEVEFDLSDVMFITTANFQDNIPLPLQDRMEIIKLPGYTEYEKLKIACGFLIPKQIKANGLKDERISFSDEAILKIIRRYTREAGVRNLEREIARACRRIAKEVVEKGKDFKLRLTAANIQRYLGPLQFNEPKIEEENEIGVATGLAWTEAGGDIIAIESTLMKGKGKLTLTGKLGEVMQESAQAALSFIRSRAAELGINDDFYKKVDIHIHVPEGAIPKDGPSAGIAIATALISSLTKSPVKKDVAMTGEITLRGKVLPIGGLKSKILAAHRVGIKTVIIPKENEKDLTEIPKNILREIKIVMVENMDKVLDIALEKMSKMKSNLERKKAYKPTSYSRIPIQS
ncbi:MAG: DNA-binding protein [Omnitrophica WOR_2 bacterium SM23_29]|nr:MAG: DNA-binding protein [Omnitrophica WOR_2 bacterium SM23_29]